MDVASKGISKVYLLASEGTIASNIYQDYFAKYNISVISASREEQEGLRSFIEAVKQNKITRECRASFLSFLSDLKESNIILGCTELPVLLSDNTIEDINLFDPMQSVIDYLKTKSADFQI
jgi:aspartate racemase